MDDEGGREISKEGLLLCKLIADRPIDLEDIAALLIVGFDEKVLLRKIRTQLACPINGRARIVSTFRRVEHLFAGQGPYHPKNIGLDRLRLQISDRAHRLAEMIRVG